jgi:NADH dehydrogenase FAD-containing subunit
MVTGSRTKILVVGGGVAGRDAISALRAVSSGWFDIELMTPQRHVISRSLAPGPPFLQATVERVELAAITARHNVLLTRDALELVEPERHAVLTQGGAQRLYDVLVLALGTTPARSVAGAMAFRGLQDLDALTAALEPVRCVAYIASSTAMWTAPLFELAVHTAAWASDRHQSLDVLVITARTVGEPLAVRLAKAGVEVMSEAVVDRFSGGHLELANGRRVAADLAVALPRLTGPLVRGLPPRSRDAHTVVDETGRVAGVPDIYAIGDMTGSRRPVSEQVRVAVAAITASRLYRRAYG